MANTLSLSLNVQNTFEGRGTNPRVRHRVPAIATSESGLSSVVAAFTGTGSNYIDVDGTGLTVNGTAATHPVTGSAYVVDAITGFAVVVERAAAGTAPTGTVAVNVGGFAKWITDGNIPLGEGGYLAFHNPGSAAVANDEAIQVLLSGTTGYKVSVIAYFEPA